jgi:hypothetical protein
MASLRAHPRPRQRATSEDCGATAAPPLRESPSPKLRRLRCVNSGLSWGFAGKRGNCSGYADDQLEGVALVWGGLASMGISAPAGEADLVAGKGGQVGEQAASDVAPRAAS